MGATTTSGGTSYDRVPYESLPFAQTHPDRLAALAHLFGLQAPAPERARVLELGCAGGGNLIPMAVALPQAQFVGIDLSPVQVAEGQALIRALGLRNITLHARSILDVDTRLGTFDYVLAHGVYSWVPDAVQDKILALCASQLSADGVAYVSYNTLPGWRMRGMVRDLMRYHAMQFDDPARRVGQARAILDFLAGAVPTQGSAYGLLLQTELENLRGAPDYYILHEHLEDINEPLYFHEFVDRARRHGLQYLAEADFSSMLDSNLPADVAGTLRQISGDIVRQEQFMDFLRNRTFRQTLLVHGSRTVQRQIRPEQVAGLWISGQLQAASLAPDLQGDGEESFHAPTGGLLKSRQRVTKAAAVVLARAWPVALPFEQLLQEALAMAGQAPVAPPPAAAGLPTPRDILASDILQCQMAGLLSVHGGPSPFVHPAGERPLASPLARWQAAQGKRHLSTLRHESLPFDPALGRLLQLLDGTRDRAALARDATAHVPGASVGPLVDLIGRAALLQA